MTDKITQSAAIELLRADIKFIAQRVPMGARYTIRLQATLDATATAVEAPTSAVAEPDDVTCDQCIELSEELQREWMRRAIAETRAAATMLNEGGFRGGMETACDEIELRMQLADSPPAEQTNTCPSCEQAISAHAWDCLFNPQNIDAEAADQIPLPSRSTGYRCPVCCAKSGEPYVEGCEARAAKDRT